MDKKETTILNAIHDFKQEMNKRFDQVLNLIELN